MNEAQVKALVGETAQEFFEAMSEGKAHFTRALALAKILQGYYELYPELTPLTGKWEETAEDARTMAAEVDRFTSSQRPRGAQAVVAVMLEQPPRQWTVAEVAQGLREKGWLPASKTPEAPVRTALERLVQTGKVEKTKQGSTASYRWIGEEVA